MNVAPTVVEPSTKAGGGHDGQMCQQTTGIENTSGTKLVNEVAGAGLVALLSTIKKSTADT